MNGHEKSSNSNYLYFLFKCVTLDSHVGRTQSDKLEKACIKPYLSVMKKVHFLIICLVVLFLDVNSQEWITYINPDHSFAIKISGTASSYEYGFKFWN